MDLAPKSTPESELWELYTQLSAAPKLLLRFKSLMIMPLPKKQLTELLERGGLKMPNGKAWTLATVSETVDELVLLKLLTLQLGCEPSIMHPVAVDTVDSDQGSLLATALRRALPSYVDRPAYRHLVNPGTTMLHLRLAIYANDAKMFEACRQMFDVVAGPGQAAALLCAVFYPTCLTLDWFTSRDPVLQRVLFESKVAGFAELDGMADDLPMLIAHQRAKRATPEYAALLPTLAHYDLLTGRLAELHTAIADLQRYDMHDQRLLLAGAVAFLERRNPEALAAYREALKLLRKNTGKRKIFLDGVHALFFLMALLHANDPALQPEIQNAITIAVETTHDDGDGFTALQAMLWLVQGQQAKARALVKELRQEMPTDQLGMACLALVEFTLDPALSRVQRSLLATQFEALAEQAPLIARIYAEILTVVAATRPLYADYLATTSPGVTLAFTQILQTQPSWERALDSLDALLGPAKGDAAGRSKDKRLAWFVDPDTLDIDVAEQAPKGKNGWTDGRTVALKRLHDRDPRLNYLTEQDRGALRAICKEASGWYDDSYTIDPMRALPALVGHPTVFDARRRSLPLELVEYPLELIVTERHGGYHVALSHTASVATVFLEAETPTRYRVIVFPERLLAVQGILGENGLTVPKAARDRLVALVQRDNPALPIRDEIGAVTHPALEGIASPVVQLDPYGEGLRLSLLVRAFGADGPAYVAGHGGRSVLANVNGQQVRANRDLQRERAERDALIAACPTLRDRGGAEIQELLIEDLEGCLELLAELQAYPGPVTIEWPADHTMQVAPVSKDMMKLRVTQDRDWFGVDGTITLDDDQVVEMRFLLDRLDKARGRFVPLGDGRWVALTRHLQAQLERLAAVSEPRSGGRRVHALGAPALDAVLAEAGEVTADVAWTQHVARIQGAEGWTPKLPATLQAELRDYQVDGFVWLSRLARWGAGACLADDMGLGKTVQAIAVLLDRAAAGPALVVAPTSVCPNWVAELTRFAPTLNVQRFAATADRAALVAALGPLDVLVCSYGLLHQAAELLGERGWATVVLDEAQAIKNAGTKRAQATQNLQAGFRLALTGTPVENYLDELWSLFNFVNPGLLGSRESFQKRFAGPIERDRDATARQALRALIRPFLLRRTKAGVLSELPPRTEQTIRIEMSEPERAFYEALRRQALERIAALSGAPGKRKIHILAEITRLRRASCNPALIDEAAGVPSGKLEAFLELTEELVRNRHRALVFSQFVGHLALMRAALDERRIKYQYLDGSTPAAERERRVAAFQAGDGDLFLISLRAGGTGLNLTAADYVVHLDPWWNPAVEDQASDRAHRMGQERPVTIYRLIMQGSIEERILQMHGEKRDLAADLLEGAEASARLGEEALLDLIRG